jgi:hypothetical protein
MSFTSAFKAALMLVFAGAMQLAAAEGARVISFYGFKDCIEVKNETARAVLCPASGGRVLEFSINGRNALWLNPDEAGKPNGASAGRFDIGPERILPQRNALFRGPYKGEINGARSARLTSGKDPSSGFQIVREFSLATDRPHLICKQTVINVSKETKQVCYWCRTFAQGQGICVVPVTGFSRMPKKHVIYDDHLVINFAPKNDSITQREGFIIVDGPPEKPKLGFDSMSGWMAYLTRNDLMFVKRWQTFPNRVYGEMASLTLSIWYPAERPVCELEPIGPREILKPGERASFTEEWFLAPHKFPGSGSKVNLPDVKKASRELMAPAK